MEENDNKILNLRGLKTNVKETKKFVSKKLADKQDKLVSGRNIKTINGEPIIGSGNIELGCGWGNITGDISQQQDLQENFINKDDALIISESIHNIKDSTGLNDDLTLPQGFDHDTIVQGIKDIEADVNDKSRLIAIAINKLKESCGLENDLSVPSELPYESLVAAIIALDDKVNALQEKLNILEPLIYAGL